MPASTLSFLTMDGQMDRTSGSKRQLVWVGKHSMVGVGEVGDLLQPLINVMHAACCMLAEEANICLGRSFELSPLSFSDPVEASAALAIVSSSSSAAAAATGSVLGCRVCDQVPHDVQLVGARLRWRTSYHGRSHQCQGSQSIGSPRPRRPSRRCGMNPPRQGFNMRQRQPPKLSYSSWHCDNHVTRRSIRRWVHVASCNHHRKLC